MGGMVTVTWTGDVFTSIGGAPQLNYGGFFLANAGAHYDLGADHGWRLNLSVDNIFDKHYGRPTGAPRDDGSGNFIVLPFGAARTFRAGVTRRF